MSGTKKKQNPKEKHTDVPALTPRQLSLLSTVSLASPARAKLKQALQPRTTHGGYESTGKRKTLRPFTSKVPVHIVMKSSRAKGAWTMNQRKHRAAIMAMTYVYADRFKVHVYRFANVGNHLHLLVKAEEKKNLSDFLRVLAGRVAVTVTGAKKYVKQIGIEKRMGKNKKKIQKFWDNLCWSRLINWGRDFYNVRNYLIANKVEAFRPEAREAVRRSGQEMANLFGWDWERPRRT